MEDIRFVLEAPQINRVQKKRPRLVTSCDNCRLKKIKCIQPAPDVLCEACSTAQIPCRFRDRERYFAERSRAVAGAAAASTGESSKKTHPKSEQQHTKPLEIGPPPESSHGSVMRSHGLRVPSYHPYLPMKDFSPVPSDSSSDALSTPPILGPLFDPVEPDRPHTTLMMTYIQAFFDNLNVFFPFLAYDETIKQFFGQELSPLMANCISALAVRYTEMPEVIERGVMYVTDQYIDKAKYLLSNAALVPTVDTLHSLILLAWAEYKRTRITNFCSYGQMAVQMALDLRLNDDSTIWLAQTEYERNSLRHTWASVTSLDSAVKSQSQHFSF